MFDSTAQNGATALQKTSHLPIAQLTPLLSTPSSRSIKAVVTLTWPYSSVTDTVAFLLAEPDFRLRRTRGQVRVQFKGSSAKAVRTAGVASGDEVILSLEGVEFVHDEIIDSTPGRGVEFELKFTERLLLQFQQEGQEKISAIDIDHPVLESEPSNPPRIPTPEPETPLPAPSVDISKHLGKINTDDEWSSPAFIKRARTSYGSLFDEDFDPFAEEDGSIPGKGRKRTRLSSSWRYISRSPTPEAEIEEPEPPIVRPIASPKPPVIMTDEGCQTVDMEVDAAEALADFARQSTNVGGTVYTGSNEFGFGAGNSINLSPFANHQTPSPRINIQPPFMQEQDQDTEEVQEEHHNQAPDSPRLQPVPSDSLPLVSPLITHQPNPFARQQDAHEIEHDQIRPQQPAVPSNAQPVSAFAEEEDLYGASPLGRHQEHPADFHYGDTIDSGIQGLYAPEHQYGPWQTVNDHNSHLASPLEAAKHYDSDKEMQSHDDMSSPINIYPKTHQYPELDDDNNHSVIPAWGHEPDTVSYPDLPDPHERIAEHPEASRHSLSAHTSRSQSIASQVIDLTEDDNEEAEGPREGNASDESEERGQNISSEGVGSGVHLTQGEGDEEDEDEEYDSEKMADPEYEAEYLRRMRAARQNVGHVGHSDDEGEGYEDEEEFEDDEDDLATFDGFDEDPQETYEGEKDEGSYDEEDIEEEMDDEMEDDEQEQRPVVRETPEVIDLLSSDDEDGSQPITKTAAQPASQLGSNGPKPGPQEGYVFHESSEIGSGDEIEKSGIVEQRSARVHSIREEYFEEEETSAYDSDGNEILAEEDEENPDENSDSELKHELVPELVDEEMSDVSDYETSHMTQHEEPVSSTPLGKSSRPIAGDQVTKGPTPSPMGRSLFDRVFNVDGANDEPKFSYPSLPEETSSPPGAKEDDEKVVEESHVESQSQINLQLPTPDDTQQSGKVISTESSFTSVTAQSSLVEIAEDKQVSLESESRVSASETIVEKSSVEEITQAQNDDIIMKDSQEIKKITVTTEETTIEEVVEQVVEEQISVGLKIIEQPDTNPLTQQEIVEDNKYNVVSSPKAAVDTPIKSEESAEDDDEMLGALEPEINNDKDLVDDENEDDEDEDDEDIVIPFEPTMSEEDESGIDDLRTIHSTQEEVVIEEAVTSEIVEPAISEGGDEDMSDYDELQTSGDNKLVDDDEDNTKHEVVAISEEDENDVEAAIAAQLSYEQPVLQEAVIQEIVEDRDHDSRPQSPKKATPSRFASLRQDPGIRALAEKLKAAKKEREAKQSAEKAESNVEETSLPVEGLRRSNRISKPITATPDKKENIPPATPTPTKSLSSVEHTRSKTHNSIDPNRFSKEPSSPMVVIDSKLTPTGHDASIELALSSPSKSSNSKTKAAAASDLRIKFQQTLRTELSLYTQLKPIRWSLNKQIDVLGIVTTTPPEPQRAKGGPRHYLVSFNITDPSIAPAGVTEVRVFRPYKEALPVVKKGDGILLREFQVISVKSRGFALKSEEGSSWAVFKGDGEVEVKGPPVEWDENEGGYVESLRDWFGRLDEEAMGRIEKANGDKAKRRESL